MSSIAATNRSLRPVTELRFGDGTHDFDFLHGSWRVRNRRLRRALTGCADWYEFDGTTVERPMWGGRANIEEYDATLPDGTRLRGLALRLYDPRLRQWTIHWSNAAAGTLDLPMAGEFRDGRGEFFGYAEHEGKRVRARFVWTSLGSRAARWEQAFSADDGRTWETNWIMEFTREGPTSGRCPVIELRRYRHHPDARDTLVELFENEFIEGQEATGMSVIAHFRDLDDRDAFTWLRGFADMPSRQAALEAFYGGPVWTRHRDAANATMIAWDDVRLLRPVSARSGFTLDAPRPARGATMLRKELVAATLYTLRAEAADRFPDFFLHLAVPLLERLGVRPLAILETEPSENTYTRLPVREGEHAFVWLASFDDAAAHRRFAKALAADAEWARSIAPAIERASCAPAEVWRLAPTARSRPLR